MKMPKISYIFIRRIKVGDLAGAALKMNLAIYGNLLVFTGLKPLTEIQVAALIDNYNSTKTAFELGGTLQKNPYRLARKALRDCMVAFGVYVNTLAMGDKDILDLSTLPLEEINDFAAQITAGAVAAGVQVLQGLAGQLLTDCLPFGTGVAYLVIVSEGVPLPAGVTVGTNGQVRIPGGTANNIFVSSNGSRKQAFDGCIEGVKYYVYYVLMYGDVVGKIGAGVSITCSK